MQVPFCVLYFQHFISKRIHHSEFYDSNFLLWPSLWHLSKHWSSAAGFWAGITMTLEKLPKDSEQFHLHSRKAAL
jgi:hypothetical protein